MLGDDGNTFVTLEDLLRDASASGNMDDICISLYFCAGGQRKM